MARRYALSGVCTARACSGTPSIARRGRIARGAASQRLSIVHEGIPATIITDLADAALLRMRSEHDNMSAVIVGADRVDANGNTASKIGAYALAVQARHYGIKYVVAAPRTSIDLATEIGADIKIEVRKAKGLT